MALFDRRGVGGEQERERFGTSRAPRTSSSSDAAELRNSVALFDRRGVGGEQERERLGVLAYRAPLQALMQQNCEVPWPFLTGEVLEMSENGNGLGLIAHRAPLQALM